MSDYPNKIIKQLQGKRCGASDLGAVVERAIEAGRVSVKGEGENAATGTPEAKRGTVAKRNLITQTSVRRRIEANISEAEIQRAILDYLTLKNILHSVTDATESFNRNGQRVRRVRAGWPDIIACVPEERHGDGQFWGRMVGIFVAVECKRPVGGRLSRDQALCLQSLWEAGAIVVIARSVEDVIRALEAKETPSQTQAEILQALKTRPR